MNGFFASLVVASGVLAQGSGESVWKTNYGDARQAAEEARTPLLVVLDRPNDPKGRVEQVAYRAAKSELALLGHYELCHIDVTTKYGKSIAAAFKATEFPYTAITDKQVKTILYEKTGRFSSDEWVTTLAAHRLGERAREPQPRRRICFS